MEARERGVGEKRRVGGGRWRRGLRRGIRCWMGRFESQPRSNDTFCADYTLNTIQQLVRLRDRHGTG